MIRQIIKRDGHTEAFSPDKINKWGEWASNTLGAHVDWSFIVTQTVATLPEETTSKFLQERLIATCLDQQTWSYYRMAGRLYAAYLNKKIHGDAIPTVATVHRSLLEAGMMRELRYSQEEYAFIETFIDHSKDFRVAHFELHQVRHKYSLRNKLTNREYETQQFVFMRMAMALAEDEPLETRLQEVRNFYEEFSEKRINAPTPNYVNLGTPLFGLASCCLYKTLDSAASLAVGDHIAYTMTYMSAGIGGNITTRNLGEAVRGGVIEHQGRLPYYRSVDGAIHANLQNGRGGAGTFFYEIFNREAATIARLKNPMSTTEKQIKGLDYAFMSNKFYARKAAKGEDVFTFSVKSAPDLYDAFYTGDNDAFETLYNQYLEDDNFEKEWVSARELVTTAMSESYEVGQHYLFFVDEVNRHTPFKEPIYSSNLCVAPETLVLTDRGYLPIASMAGQVVRVWNGKGFSEAPVEKTGESQRLIKVVTDSGQEIECTPYHKFYIFNGYGKEYLEVRAGELKEGDKLAKFDLPVVGGYQNMPEAYLNGFFTGDGSHVGNAAKIYLYHDKMKLAHLPEFAGGGNWYYEGLTHRMYKMHNGLFPKFTVPNSDVTVNSRLQWLAGYADADGCIYRNGPNQQLVLASINRDFLKDTQLMLQTLGVSAKVKLGLAEGISKLPLNDGSGDYGDYETKSLWRLIVTSNDLQHLLQMGLKFNRLEVVKHTPQRDAKQFVKVEGVVDEGRVSDTYCLNEPDRHMAMFNGILTGQCMEILTPTQGYESMPDLYSHEDHGRGEVAICTIGGVVVANIHSDEQYFKTMYYALKMVDKCIHQAEYKLPHVGVTAKSRLNAGIGIMGLAHHMARKGLPYSSEEGKAELHRVAERHMYFAIEASLTLGQELGNAPWMHKTKWPEGWLPIDTYNRQVDSVASPDYQYDWEDLRGRVIENGGIRNSVVVAHMPGESSSKGSGDTNSIYPVRDLTLMKTDNGIVTSWAAPEGEVLENAYEYAWDITTHDMIDAYAIFQKFTDQSISADLYRRLQGKSTIGTKEMLTDYFYMVKMGLKTRYYQNSLTSKGLNLETGKEEFEEMVGEAGCGPDGVCAL